MTGILNSERLGDRFTSLCEVDSPSKSEGRVAERLQVAEYLRVAERYVRENTVEHLFRQTFGHYLGKIHQRGDIFEPVEAHDPPRHPPGVDL